MGVAWCAACALMIAGCFRQPAAPDVPDGGGPGGGDANGSADGGGGTMHHNTAFVTAGEFGPPWDSGAPTHAAYADSFCNNQAQQTGLAGNFVAWLSFGSGENASDTLRGLPGAFEWYTTTGSLFAHTVDDLVTPPLMQALVLDQFGTDVTIATPGVEAATGTAQDGTYDGGTSADCPAGSIEIGYPGRVDAGWTAGGETTCNGAHLRLYCFSFGL